jgi:phage-related protein
VKGIAFGGLHSYRDLNLILSSKEIGAPPVKENKLDIEGADGSIDLTEVFGRPTYGDVTHKFTFSTIVPRNEFLTQYSMVKNALHGQKLRIILDDDPAFYYVGRCYVSSFTSEKGIGTISVDCDCEPYKYKLTKTVVTRAVDGTEAITLTNGRKRAVPVITTTAAMTISFGGGAWTNGAGTYTIPDLELVQGENTITVTGTGTISFEYQEGDL